MKNHMYEATIIEYDWIVYVWFVCALIKILKLYFTQELHDLGILSFEGIFTNGTVALPRE